MLNKSDKGDKGDKGDNSCKERKMFIICAVENEPIDTKNLHLLSFKNA
ncbi:MAG: hypothetical protein F6K41_00465 [Symploca sp. SIO3E6]|nr:hypothetical protein [Caldora sp. SIO3E6]